MSTPPESSRIARDSLYSLGMRVLQLLFDGAILVLTARGLGVEGRGLYTLVLVGAMLAQVPLAGIATPLASEVAHGRRPIHVLAGAGALVAGVGGGLVAIVIALASLVWVGTDLLFVAVAVPPLLLLNFQQNLALARGRVLWYGLLFILPSMVSLSALLAGIVGSDDARVAMAYWCAAQWLVPLAVLVVERPAFRLRGQRDLYRNLLRRGAPVSVATGISRLNYRVNTLVVAAMLPLGDVGRFSVAVTGAETLWQLSRAITTASYRSVVSAPKAEATRVAVRVFRHSFLLIGLGGLVGTVAAIVLVQPVFGEDYTGVWEAFALLVPGTIAFGASEVLRNYFTVRLERSREFLTTSIVSVVVSLAVALSLVPLIGITGAAIATSVAYASSAVYLVRRFRAEGGERSLRAYVPGPADLRRYGQLLASAGRRLPGR